jgi:hypothetical protein
VNVKKKMFTECVGGLGSYVSNSVGWDQLVGRDRLVEPDTEVLKYILGKQTCMCVGVGLTWLGSDLLYLFWFFESSNVLLSPTVVDLFSP